MVDHEYLPELSGAYLEDSYFLGIVAERNDLRLHCLFALTVDHPDYAPPLPGEAHCYRRGSFVIEQPAIIEWRAGQPVMLGDLDSTFDLGSIELHRKGMDRFRFVTEWFDAIFETKALRVEFDPHFSSPRA